MSTEAERSVLHVLPHPGGGGETYVDLLDDMPGYRFEKLYLTPHASALSSVARGVIAVTRAAGRHDLLHVHGEVVAGLCIPLLARRPSIVTLHGLNLVRRLGGARRAVARLNLRMSLRAANRTICVSESEYRELIRAVGAAAAQRAVVVRNGVRAVVETTAEERLAVRESLELGASDTVAIWVGALADHKDPLAAVRAAEETSVTLLVVGDGPLRSQVERAAGAHVRVLGPRGDVDRLLGASDIYVLTSQHEGLSFSLLEAMALGLPSIVTDLPENTEAAGDSGIVVPLGNDRELAAALRRVVENPGERTTLAARAHERVLQHFRAEEMVRGTREVYDEILSRRRRRDGG